MQTYVWIGVAIVAVIIAWLLFFRNSAGGGGGSSSNSKDFNSVPDPIDANDFVSGHQGALNEFDNAIDGSPGAARSFVPLAVPVTGPIRPMSSEPHAGEGIVAKGDFVQLRSTQGFCDGVDRYGPHTTMSVSAIGSPGDLVAPSVGKNLNHHAS